MNAPHAADRPMGCTSTRRLWLLRHAQVQGGDGLCYGVTDLPVDRADTLEAAQSFAPCPAPGAVLWVSPAQRTQDLAQALWAQRPDLCAPRVDERLREMDFGVWEGQAWSEIPEQALQAWTDDFAWHPFGGQESAQAVVQRVAHAWDELWQTGAVEAVWVTHAGVIRALQFLRTHGRHAVLRSAQDWPQEAPAMGQWCCITGP